MLVREHAETAREFLVESDADFAADDLVRGSAKLWGAVAHAVMAVARRRGWSCDESHSSLQRAAIRLSKEEGDPLIAAQFAAAGKFFHNLYPDDMEDYERDADSPIVHDFVHRVLALLDSDNGANGAR